MTNSITQVAGIDTGKAWLDVASHPSGERARFANGAAGHRALRTWLSAQGVTRIGIEASGGYEQEVVADLRRQGLEVALLQPRQVSAFRQYKGRRAKTDDLDAALIAECTAHLGELPEAPDPRLAAFAQHLLFIEQLEADVVRIKTRREHFTDPRILRWIDRDIEARKRRCIAELALLKTRLCKHADLEKRLGLVESVAGIGLRTALTLVILLPELGKISREQIAALVGVAPYDDSSGQRTGDRHIAGGRARVRRALFNAALPASQRWNQALVGLYGRLKTKGKAHKTALIACVRKLLIFANAVIERGTPWIKA